MADGGFREAIQTADFYDVSKYVDGDASTLGGAIALTSLMRDLIAGGIGFVGTGIAMDIRALAEANTALIGGLAGFFVSLADATYGYGAEEKLSTAFATSAAAIQNAGLLAWVYAVVEVVLIVVITVKLVRFLIGRVS